MAEAVAAGPGGKVPGEIRKELAVRSVLRPLSFCWWRAGRMVAACGPECSGPEAVLTFLRVFCRRLTDDFQLNQGYSGLFHADFGSGGGRQVNHPTSMEWAAIVNAHLNRFVVAEIGDPYIGAKRQHPMRSRQLTLAEFLTAGRFSTVEFVGIHCGQTFHRFIGLGFNRR